MKTYNTLNVVIYFLSILLLIILLSMQFDSDFYTVIQMLFILLSLLGIRLTHYDFKQFYNSIQ